MYTNDRYGKSGCVLDPLEWQQWHWTSYLVSSSGRAHCGPSLKVSEGEVLVGNMSRTDAGNTNARQQNWELTALRVSTGQISRLSTQLSLPEGAKVDTAYVTLEAMILYNCDAYPATLGTRFTENELIDGAGQAIALGGSSRSSWLPKLRHDECGQAAVPEGNAVVLRYRNATAMATADLAGMDAALTYGVARTAAGLTAPVAQPSFAPSGDRFQYLDNGVIRVGIDLTRGGSIGFLGVASDPSVNVINSHDMGREVQLSFYSGPSFYNPPTSSFPNGACNKLFMNKPWPWNPIGAGDVDGNHGAVLNLTSTSTTAHLLTRPLQWACHNVACDCTFEQTFSLATPAGTGVRVDNVLHTARTDATPYPPASQELPAVYSNAPFHRLITYNGSRPFTSDALAEYSPGWDASAGLPWVPGAFPATESWAAMVNEEGWGMGVVSPSTTTFLGGFSGTKGPGGSADPSTGYIAPTATVSIPPRGEFKFTFYLVLGDVHTIRSFAQQVQERMGNAD